MKRALPSLLLCALAGTLLLLAGCSKQPESAADIEAAPAAEDMPEPETTAEEVPSEPEAEALAEEAPIETEPAEPEPQPEALPEIAMVEEIPDTLPPGIVIVSPENNSFYRSSILLTGYVADSHAEPGDGKGEVDRVTLDSTDPTIQQRSVSLGEDGYFSTLIDTSDVRGSLILTVSAWDTLGNSSEEYIILTEYTGFPLIRLEEPMEGVVYRSSLTVKGIAADAPENIGSVKEIRSVTLYIPGVYGPESIPFAEGGFEQEISLSGVTGTITLIGAVEDKNGRKTEQTVTLVDDGVGPGLILMHPENNSLYSGGMVEVSGTVQNSEDDPGVTEVSALSYRIGKDDSWRALEFTGSGQFSFEVDTSGAAGSLSIGIKSEDLNGHATETLLTLQNPGEGPSIDIVSPSEGGIYQSTLQVEGTTDGVTLSYELLGTTGKGKADLDRGGGFSFSLDTSGRKGPLVLSLTAEDSLGRFNERTVRLRDDGEGPYFRVSSPRDGDEYGAYIEVQGRIGNSSAERQETSEVSAIVWEVPGIGAKGSGRFRLNGEFSFEIPMLGVTGKQVVNFTAFDLNGNTTEVTLNLVKVEVPEGVPPLLDVASPEDESFYSNDIVLSGIIADSPDNPASTSEIAYLYYNLGGPTGTSEEIYFDLDGAFFFTIPGEYLKGVQHLTIAAEKNDGSKTVKDLTLYDGGIVPEIEIEYPLEGSSFGSVIVLGGNVLYRDDGVPLGKGIRRVSFEIFSEEGGNFRDEMDNIITLRRDGSFSRVITTEELEGSQVITVKAEAWNGNTSEQKLELFKGSSDFPSFTAVSGANRVVFDWNPLPIPGDYTLYLSSEEGDQVIRDAVPPYTVSSLRNGEVYRCFLEGYIEEIDLRLNSATVTGIPLEQDTLKPVVKGEYGQIRVSWNALTKYEGEYVVLRADREDGEYVPVSGTVAETVVIDGTTRFGTRYYYRVRTAPPGSVKSIAVFGEPLAAPEVKIDRTGEMAGGGFQALLVHGSYLFAVGPEKGLRIVDVSTPRKPEDVAALPLEDARSVTVMGEYAYVSSGKGGLVILDISNPSKPVEIGSKKTSSALKSSVKGDFVYVADGEYGIKIIDISNPKRPNRVGRVATEQANSLVIAGEYLYLADGSAGIKIFRLDGTNLTREGIYVTSNALDLVVSENRLFVADGDKGLVVLDVRDPTRPSFIGSYDTSYAKQVMVNGRYIYILDEDEGLIVIDAYDPSRLNHFDTYALESGTAAAVQDATVYLAGREKIQVINVFTSGQSYVLGRVPTGGYSYGVTTHGSSAFIADHQGGVKIIDVTLPKSINEKTPVKTIRTSYAEQVVIQQGIVYVSDGQGGIKGISLDTIENLAEGEGIDPEVTVETAGPVRRIAFNGQLCAAAEGGNGIEFFDMTDLSKIRKTGELKDIPGKDVVFSGDYLLIAGGDYGLSIGRVQEGIYTQAARVSGIRPVSLTVRGTILLAGGMDGVSIIDISRKTEPEILGFYPTDAFEDAVFDGRYAYIAEGYKGLTVLDLENPGYPVLVSRCSDVFAFGVDLAPGEGEITFAVVSDVRGINIVEIHIPSWLK